MPGKPAQRRAGWEAVRARQSERSDQREEDELPDDPALAARAERRQPRARIGRVTHAAIMHREPDVRTAGSASRPSAC